MEERPRVSPSEILRGNRPLEREDMSGFRRPSETRPPVNDEPEAPKSELLDPRDLERQVSERRNKNPNYLVGRVTSGGGGAKIPADVYEVELVRIEESTIKNKYDEENPNSMKDMWEWHFRIVDSDVDYRGTMLRAMSSQSMHETSKAFRWVGEILGRSLSSGEEIDLASLFGKRCRVNVKFNDAGFSSIDDVMKLSPRSVR